MNARNNEARSQGRWPWLAAVFFGALIGGAAGGVVIAKTLIGAWVQNDSMLFGFLTSALSKGDLESRLRTIEAAERNDPDAVIRLNCAYLNAATIQFRGMAKGSHAPEAFDTILEKADAAVARLKAEGRCGSPAGVGGQ